MRTRSLLVPILGMMAFSFSCLVQADDKVRSAQDSLKALGYYSGPVDGEINADLKGAVRRYQKRNGLAASGDLDAETVAALGKGDLEAGQPAAPATPEAKDAPVSPPAPTLAPEPRGATGPSAESDFAYAEIFAGTPYSNAPAVVQRDTVRRAQGILAEHHYFDGAINGRPNPATEEAILRYQSSAHLRKTGRLDIDTLARLHLLPVARVPASRAIHRIPRVYEGRVPDRSPGPPGAVRGIPLD